MRETSDGLLVSRILVLKDEAYPVLRVELANMHPRIDPDEWPGPQDRLVQVLHEEDLVQLASEYAADGLLFTGKRTAIGGSGLPGLLPRLRPRYAGWLGLEATGPEPQDLQAVLGESQLDLVDVELAWLERDVGPRQGRVLVDPSLRQIVSILLEAKCPCVIRFMRPAEEKLFNEVSSAFDAFVRISAEPVAVQVIEPAADAPGSGQCAVEAMEFIACRPAWLVRESQGQWYQMQPEGRYFPRPQSRQTGARRRRRPRL